MSILQRLIFVCAMLLSFTSFSQVVSIGDVEVDFKSPKTYEIGPIRVDGADNYDHNAIKLLADLRQGQSITIPGEKISRAIKNLWDEGLFSNIEILTEKEVAGIIYLVIKVTPRAKLSRFKFVGVNKT